MKSTKPINLLSFYKKFLLFTIPVLTLQAKAQHVGTPYAEALKTKQATFYCLHRNTIGFAEEKNGEVSGLLVDLMADFEKYAEQKSGIAINVEYPPAPIMDFVEFLNDTKTSKGAVFALSNISISEERKQEFTFSPPYLVNFLILVSNNTIPSLTEASKLGAHFKGKTAYTIPKSTYEQSIKTIQRDYIPDLEIKYLPSAEEVLKGLESDPNGFGIIDLHYYVRILEEGKPIRRHKVAEIEDDSFGIAMPKSNDWAPLLDEFMQSGYLQSNEYKQLIQKYLGERGLRMTPK